MSESRKNFSSFFHQIKFIVFKRVPYKNCLLSYCATFFFLTYPGWFNMELPNSPNLVQSYSKLSLKKWSQTDKGYWRKFVTKLYLVSIAKNKDPSIRIKMHQTSFLFLPLVALYLLSGCDLFNMSCLSCISFMASLNILCSNPLNIKNKFTKTEIRKYFVAHQKCWKIFHGPSIYA